MTTGTLSRHLAATADDAFRTLTDLARLPEWNGAITRVIDAPHALVPGTEWVVEVTALGRRWPSRARLMVLDQVSRTFSYRSATDDGNPSHAEWVWRVVEVQGGCEVTVSWELRPATFWRRVLLARVRQYQLRRVEVPASLTALSATVDRKAASE